MTVTIDQEKWLAAIAEEPEGYCAAASPYFWFSVRRHPEVDEDKLSAMVAVLITYIQDLDRSLGGAGVQFDPSGTIQTDQKLTIQLAMMATDGFLRRIYAITDKLAELSKQAKQTLVTRQDADINAKIAAVLGPRVTPEVREAAEYLEPLRV